MFMLAFQIEANNRQFWQIHNDNSFLDCPIESEFPKNKAKNNKNCSENWYEKTSFERYMDGHRVAIDVDDNNKRLPEYKILILCEEDREKRRRRRRR